LDKIDELNNNNINVENTNNKIGFISLDVISMYPTINLTKSIPIVIEFINEHMDEIDSFGLNDEQIKNGLSLLCFNYEIEYNKTIYKQIKGIPMGTRFAPPFAIIYLNYIEQKALKNLREIQIFPKVYVRYIDDILIGPIELNENNYKNILKCFNDIDCETQFTLEYPNDNGYIPYLDISLRVNIDSKIEYKWYQKEFNSGLCLNKNSYIPSFMKTNFVRNRINDVNRRCNNNETREICLKKIYKILTDNGHNVDLKKKTKKHKNVIRQNQNYWKNENNENNNTPIMKLPFLNDRSWNQIQRTIKKYNLKIKLVMEKRKTLHKLYGPTEDNQCISNCYVCEQLPNHFNCRSRFVVYSLTCKLCNNKNQYIGETCVWLIDRINQHRLSIKNKDSKSAVSVHMKEMHPEITPTIGHFKLKIEKKCKDSYDALISEAIWIKRRKPSLNRKFEINDYNVDYK
jgi:hypothetical protein